MSEGFDLVIVCRWLCGPEMCGGNNSGVAALFFDTHWVKLVRQFQFARGIWNNIV
jgi:aminopeptidase-like protein